MTQSHKLLRRRGRKPEKLGRVLTQESQLDSLRERSKALAAVKSALWPHLPHSTRQHCDLANFRDSTLFLVADSPVWAARLRHMSRQILHAARDRCKIPANRVKVKIAFLPTQPEPIKQPRLLSESTKTHLNQAAESTTDPDLAAILRRIGSRGRSV